MKSFIKWMWADPVRQAFAIVTAILIVAVIIVILMPLPERTPFCTF